MGNADRGVAAVLLLVFAGMLAAFQLGTARLVASGRAAGMVHRDTVVHGDGARLYAWLRSAWFDRDLDTANELERYFNYPGSREAAPVERTPSGYAWNHTPVGCAVLWSPFFAVGHATALRMRELGIRVEADGYSAPYTLAVAAGTHLYGFLGILLLFAMCRRWYPPLPSLLAAITIWLGSFLPAYLFLYPSMSHAHSFFAVSLFLWLWLGAREKGGALRWAALGLAGGLAGLVRTQNLLFLAVPLAGVIAARPGRDSFRDILLMLACAAAAFFPQLYVWKAAHGSWLTIPQGGGFLHWGRPAVFEVLFSPRHGLLSWTPALALGFLGLPSLIRRDRVFGASLIAVFLAQLYVNSIADDWWAGTGFGARRFDNCLPMLGLGTAGAFEWLRGRRMAWLAALLAGALIAWNGLFLAQYAGNRVSHSEAVSMGEIARGQARMALDIAKQGAGMAGF